MGSSTKPSLPPAWLPGPLLPPPPQVADTATPTFVTLSHGSRQRDTLLCCSWHHEFVAVWLIQATSCLCVISPMRNTGEFKGRTCGTSGVGTGHASHTPHLRPQTWDRPLSSNVTQPVSSPPPPPTHPSLTIHQPQEPLYLYGNTLEH